MGEERCFECDELTGKAGQGEDSLYDGDFGPFCQACFDSTPTGRSLAEITRLRALNAGLVAACNRYVQWQDELNAERTEPLPMCKCGRCLVCIMRALVAKAEGSNPDD